MDSFFQNLALKVFKPSCIEEYHKALTIIFKKHFYFIDKRCVDTHVYAVNIFSRAIINLLQVFCPYKNVKIIINSRKTFYCLNKSLKLKLTYK